MQKRVNPLLIEYIDQIRELNELSSELQEGGEANNLTRASSIIIDYEINKIVDKYQPNLGFNYRDVVKHSNLLREAPQLDEKLFYTLSDLDQENSESLDWIVPPLVPPGDLVILFGKAKSKKSLLGVYDLAYAISTGTRFLGFPTKKGKVLIFQREESRSSVQRRLRTRGFFDEEAKEAVDNDMVLVYRNFELTTDLGNLAKIIQQEKPVLCIFDSLRAITAKSNVPETSTEFAKFVYELQRTLILNDCAGVLIHHANKSSAQQGVDSMSGTSALQGACFSMWQLKSISDSADDPRSELIIKPRDGDPMHFLIKTNAKENRRWNFELLEEVGVPPEVLEQEQQINRALSLVFPNKLDLRQLNKELNLPENDTSLYRALNRLLERMIIESESSGKTTLYYLPENSVWREDDIESLIGNLKAAQIAPSPEIVQEIYKLLKCKTRKQIYELSLEWNSETKRRIWAGLSPPEREKINTIWNFTEPSFQMNEEVTIIDNGNSAKVIDFYINESQWQYQLDNFNTYSEDLLEKRDLL